jgi:hypothetical protein
MDLTQIAVVICYFYMKILPNTRIKRLPVIYKAS